MKIIKLGKVDYIKALRMQERLHQECLQENSTGSILVLEHPRVVTYGKNTLNDGLRLSLGDYERRGIPLVQTDRGGDLTAHMPGQLVFYPIINLVERNIGVRDYIFALEDAVIKALSHYGIQARRDSSYPGVWVDKAKICALGVRVKRRVTMHGFALNVNNDLDLFSTIVPCGIRNRGVCSMQDLLALSIDLDEVADVLLKELLSALAVKNYVSHNAKQPKLQSVLRD